MSNSTTKPSDKSNKALGNQDLGGHEIKVIYNPKLSDSLTALIHEHITPSMSSNDESSHQYEASHVLGYFKDKKFNDVVSDIDLTTLMTINHSYDYFEI